MNAQAELHKHFTDVIADVIENHPGPTTEVMAGDVAVSLIERFGLEASKRLFIEDNGDTRPAENLRFIHGRMVVSRHG